ncbi:MAG: hypothetical protein IT348_14955, partial [Candidatus Eisenbacteria bacterium]|nr:hypothetical protein [Candidatus Eisenbacteria bacterium]
QRPWIVKVDMAGMLSDIALNGYTIGSTHYTSAYITGGLFSLDGVHPNDLAHAILANGMIDAVNSRFGAGIPRANVMNYASGTSASLRPAMGENPLEGMAVEGLDAVVQMLSRGRR